MVEIARDNDDELARLSVLQELTVACTALFDPGQSLDLFLERLAARLGSPVSMCIEVGVDGEVKLLGDAGLSTSSRALSTAAWPTTAGAPLPDLKIALPFPEVRRPTLGYWQFQLGACDGPSVWLVLMFDLGASPSEGYRAVIERLAKTLRAALRQREAAAMLLATTTRLTLANLELRHEIEERKRAEETLLRTEEQLRQAQKMEAIGRLAGGLAHDFNNLVMVIGGCSAVLRRQMPTDAPLREPVELIAQAAVQAGSLTHQLLAFSRQQVMHPRVLDLNALVNETQTMLRRLIGEDIEIASSLAYERTFVLADPGQIVQLLMNLAVNARDSMPDGGTLTIETANAELDDVHARHLGITAGRYVTLAVTDTGVGMDAATQSRVFEPFFTTKEVGKGTGLGLSTVYGVVKQSGGAISVESEVGRGTTFRIHLPTVDDVPVPDAHPVGNIRSCDRTATVLVVEDNSMVRALVERFVASSGYQVLVASCGEEALAIHAGHAGPIDVLVTDVIMPRMSGSVLAKRLLQLRPEMHVILVSGFTSDTHIGQEVLELGASFLQKPFTNEALIEKIREALAAPTRGDR